MLPKQCSLRVFLFVLVAGVASSSYIADEILESHGSTGRSLLQQKKACAVDFAHMNYTVITSQCKGPNYSSDRCCPPLKVLLCPVHDEVNDLTTNCADTFFSYVNLYGKYPPGLFASLCKGDAEGLDCSDVEAPPPAAQTSGAPRAALLRHLMAIVSAGVATLVMLHV